MSAADFLFDFLESLHSNNSSSSSNDSSTLDENPTVLTMISTNSTTLENSSSNDFLFDIPPWLVVTLIAIYTTITLTAIVGNGAIIFVVCRSRRLWSVTNYFIANLAGADIAIAVLAIPFQFQAALLQKWLLPHFMCQLCPTVQVLSLNVSIFTLVAIALDRHRAVIHPLSTRTSKCRTNTYLIVIWMASITLAVPTFMAYEVRYVLDGSPSGDTKAQCQMRGWSVDFWRVYTQFMVAAQYVIPLMVITWAYVTMGLKLTHVDKTIAQGARSNSEEVERNRKRVSRYSFSIKNL